MKRSELEHIIRATGSILGEDTVIIVGSQAILHPDPRKSCRRRRCALSKGTSSPSMIEMA